MGGFYERLVGIVKRVFKKSIGKICLIEDQFEIFLIEVEVVINFRLFVYVGEDFDFGFLLVLVDFLNFNFQFGVFLIEINNLYDLDYGKKSLVDKLLEFWGKGQRYLNSFWRVWKDDYLFSFRERGQIYVKGFRI